MLMYEDQLLRLLFMVIGITLDAKTRFTWNYPLHLKSQVANTLLQFLRIIETQFGK